MTRSIRRFAPLVAVAVVLSSLAACATDSTAPSSSAEVRSTNLLCESQGSNTKC